MKSCIILKVSIANQYRSIHLVISLISNLIAISQPNPSIIIIIILIIITYTVLLRLNLLTAIILIIHEMIFHALLAESVWHQAHPRVS